tara:strand:+ start:9033 stop:9188 length:156 start_codon:yes stop_codon:yes gene_type:complete
LQIDQICQVSSSLIANVLHCRMRFHATSLNGEKLNCNAIESDHRTVRVQSA